MAKRVTVNNGRPSRFEARLAADAIDVGRPAVEQSEVEQSEDEQLAVTAGEAVREFVRTVAAFFLTARRLEASALALAQEAFLMRPSTTEAEDLAVQTFIRRTSAENKIVEEHWKITTTISGFHRRMTAKRAIATDAIKAANATGNRLHTVYVEAEQRRAREEQDRLRREEEARVQAARDLELAALEEEAIRREEATADLTARETTFVELYMARGDGASAARAAGFKAPAKDAARLLTLPKVQAAIAAKKAAATIRQQAAAVARQPLIVDTPDVRPNIAQAAGSFERKGLASAELLDEAGLVDAIFSGRFGIPRTILKIDQVALNQQARDLGALINKWPGVRYKAGESKVY